MLVLVVVCCFCCCYRCLWWQQATQEEERRLCSSGSDQTHDCSLREAGVELPYASINWEGVGVDHGFDLGQGKDGESGPVSLGIGSWKSTRGVRE